jgi:hypothetical protein
MSAGAQKDNWRDTILAGLANYIDAGSIVAGSAALALWQEHYKLSNDFIGLIGAFGPNAIGAGVGAYIGGRSATSSAARRSTNGTCSSMPWVWRCWSSPSRPG